MGEIMKLLEDKYNSFITICNDDYFIKSDNEESKSLLLKNIKFGIKDNISTKNIQTTCGSKILSGYIPSYDAFVVSLIKKEGGIIIGKTNMDEFGMGSTTENSAYGPTLNPIDETRVPGGSSGGSAAAVSSGVVDMALGSDTGGSIRCPASYCGIVGLKPTYGKVSRYGLIAYSNSFEQIGPMGKSINDVEKLFSVISKHDNNDSTSLNINDINIKEDNEKKNIKKIGLPKEYFEKGVDPNIKDRIKEIAYKLEENGYEIINCTLPSLKYALAAYYVVCTCEASSNLGRYDGVRFGPKSNIYELWVDSYKKLRSKYFGDEVKKRIVLGTYALSESYYGKYYMKAKYACNLIKNDFKSIFKKVDFLIGPTMPTIAPKIGSIKNSLEMYQTDILTVPSNISGIPSISIPCGTFENMPIGMQIMSKWNNEKGIFDLAKIIENYKKV